MHEDYLWNETANLFFFFWFTGSWQPAQMHYHHLVDRGVQRQVDDEKNKQKTAKSHFSHGFTFPELI